MCPQPRLELCWGFNADYQLVPDVRNFVKAIDASFKELAAAAGAASARQHSETPLRDVIELHSEAKQVTRRKRKHRRAAPDQTRIGPRGQATRG